MRRRPPRSTRNDTLFPYTTLFRSGELVSIRPIVSGGDKNTPRCALVLYGPIEIPNCRYSDGVCVSLGLDNDLAAGDGIGVESHGVNATVGACRSEEHTSELQSLMRTSYAVFCSKKKNKNRY